MANVKEVKKLIDEALGKFEYEFTSPVSVLKEIIQKVEVMIKDDPSLAAVWDAEIIGNMDAKLSTTSEVVFGPTEVNINLTYNDAKNEFVFQVSDDLDNFERFHSNAGNDGPIEFIENAANSIYYMISEV